jgi:proteasome assembly chaperone (PAC2) family protein
MEERTMLEFHDQVELEDPVLIAAFRGWNDAGDAASFAAQHLVRVWGGKRFASIDPEEFFDFQSVRPQVHLDEGMTRQITWPSNDLYAARLPGTDHDVLIMVGTEPSHRWKTFSGLIVDVAERAGVSLVVTLGALLADVPHTRPVPITGTAGDKELVERLELQRSRYEGPTGIVGVLHDAFASAGIPSASLWAAMPHYLAVTPNPKGALALVDKVVNLVRIGADVSDLENASRAYEERVSEIVNTDDDVQHYVRMLEDRVDERDQESVDLADLPSGDALAAELERFLRERDS